MGEGRRVRGREEVEHIISINNVMILDTHIYQLITI